MHKHIYCLNDNSVCHHEWLFTRRRAGVFIFKENSAQPSKKAAQRILKAPASAM